MSWYENRVNYHNLKIDDTLNSLSDADLQDLWIPYIIFQNTDNNEAVTIDGIRSTAFVTRESSFERSTFDVADEIEIFKGSENKLTVRQTYSKRFHCTYLLHFFPFDTQVCRLFHNIWLIIKSLYIYFTLGNHFEKTFPEYEAILKQ